MRLLLGNLHSKRVWAVIALALICGSAFRPGGIAPVQAKTPAVVLVKSCTFAAVKQALKAASARFACDGTISFSRQLTVSSGSHTLSASGRSVAFDGQFKHRLFKVVGGSLTLVDLTLQGGRAAGGAGRSGKPGAMGKDGEGGSDGANGANGSSPGQSGGNGQPGGMATDGTDGGKATRGLKGGDGQGGAVFVGKSGTLMLAGDTLQYNSASGGVGGLGGYGGEGGDGGNGGNGGNGGYGADNPNGKGGDAGAGGDGGSSGTGANGGEAGDGGDGGDGQGGAIYSEGHVVVVATAFVNDTASGGWGGEGGYGSLGGIGGGNFEPNANGGYAAAPGDGSNGLPTRGACARAGNGSAGADAGNDGKPGGGGGGGDGNGGAIFSSGSLVVSGGRFTSDRAQGGGGGVAFGVINSQDGTVPIGGAGGWGGSNDCDTTQTGGAGANGGNGGDGADGGEGGAGGNAEGGAIAGSGDMLIAHSAFNNVEAAAGSGYSGAQGAPGGPGGNGGNGGVGNTGGAAGDGGDGGDGGNGGNGGSGGIALGGVIQSDDVVASAHLTFQGSAVVAGAPGSGGAGAKGGDPGTAGRGGLGRAGTNGADGSPGTAGADGNSGSAGAPGASGHPQVDALGRTRATGLKLSLKGTTTATVGKAYVAGLTATGGKKPYHWMVLGLPPGLAFDAGHHRITGRPSTKGTYQVVMYVTDSNTEARVGSRAFTLTVR